MPEGGAKPKADGRKPKQFRSPKADGRRLPAADGNPTGAAASWSAAAGWRFATVRPGDPKRQPALTSTRNSELFFGLSQRDCILQPRVASRRATLGTFANQSPTPTGLCLSDPRRGHNPVGVVTIWAGQPRVARPSQPWASGRNPVGIQRRTRVSWWSIRQVRCRFGLSLGRAEMRQRTVALQDAGAQTAVPSAAKLPF